MFVLQVVRSEKKKLFYSVAFWLLNEFPVKKHPGKKVISENAATKRRVHSTAYPNVRRSLQKHR